MKLPAPEGQAGLPSRTPGETRPRERVWVCWVEGQPGWVVARPSNTRTYGWASESIMSAPSHALEQSCLLPFPSFAVSPQEAGSCLSHRTFLSHLFFPLCSGWNLRTPKYLFFFNFFFMKKQLVVLTSFLEHHNEILEKSRTAPRRFSQRLLLQKILLQSCVL